MNSNVNISVIIPSYKPGEYLWECLNSLCKQTIGKEYFEIILILNGCKEPYYTQIQSYASSHQDLNISIIQTDEPGVSNARNIGIEICHGAYLTFIDDDDIVSSTYLEKLYKISSSTCVGCSNSYAFKNSIEKLENNFITRGFRSCIGQPFSLCLYKTFFSPPWAKLIHKSIIGHYRFPLDMTKSEDSVFGLLISPNVKEMKLTDDDAIYFQRLRLGSSVRKNQSLASIIKEHMFIEYKYISVWLLNPFRYNLVFFLSRLIACIYNCCFYIKNKKLVQSQ